MVMAFTMVHAIDDSPKELNDEMPFFWGPASLITPAQHARVRGRNGLLRSSLFLPTSCLAILPWRRLRHSAPRPVRSRHQPITPAFHIRRRVLSIVPEKTTYNSCNVEGMSIAITFDDGPNPELTPRLLDMLKERGIKATFFVVGKNVEEYPGIVARMAQEGHEVANHSWSHPTLTKLGVESFRKQIENTNQAIAKATGKRPVLMRPPYGATNVSLNKRLNEQFGLKVILWSVDPLDWKYRNSNRVYTSIIQNTRPGSIILAHDIHATTVAAMPATLDALLAKVTNL